MIVTDQQCPCNSGKKIKDCCFTKKNVMLEKHWTNIKGRILQTFISEHPTEVEIDTIHQWVGAEKMERFEERMDAATLQHLLIDAYFFTENRQQWGYHLIKSMKEIVQPRTHAILTSWQKPYYFMGEVLQTFEEFVITKHIWTDEIVYLADVDVEDPIQGDILMGHIVPGVNASFYNLLSSAIVLDREQSHALDEWYIRFKEKDNNNLEDFFQNELLNCLFALVAETTVSNNQDSNIDLEALQLIINLDVLLIDLDIKSDRLTLIFFNYLMEYISSMKVRKKAALVGAILDFGVRYDFIPKTITQKKLAELLDVSPSTIARHSRKIGLYFDQDFDVRMLEKIRQPVYRIGTDPDEEEFILWQTERNLEKMIFTTVLEKKRMEKKLLGMSFKPITQEDKAQKYAYEAYLAESIEKRYELAKLAYMHDAKNLDANLILNENQDIEQRLEILQRKDLHAVGSIAKDRLFTLKIVLLYSLGNFEEAYELVKEIPTTVLTENNSVNYLYCLLHFMFGNDYPIHQFLNTNSEDSAVTKWLLWLVAFKSEDENADSLHIEAIQSNPFVQKYIELNIKPTDFPRNQTCTKGDPNEAKIIHLLVFTFLK